MLVLVKLDGAAQRLFALLIKERRLPCLVIVIFLAHRLEEVVQASMRSWTWSERSAPQKRCVQPACPDKLWVKVRVVGVGLFFCPCLGQCLALPIPPVGC